MDLLGSILNSMDKPPTPNERERKASKELKDKLEKQQLAEKKKREAFRSRMIVKIGEFENDPDKERLKFPPMDKIYRAIVHELADTAGLLAYSFGMEDVDRHIIVFKKEHPPSDAELQALKRGEVYVPGKDPPKTPEILQPSIERRLSQHKEAPASNYQDKYRHLIGSECAEKSAVKMEPKKQFGFVPSENKKDLRSIEETLQDIRTKKRARIAEQTQESAPSSAVSSADGPARDKRLRIDESEGRAVRVTDTRT